MKTKISHLGRSTVSVILAVMMLLSTMLIGTVSTVNATVNDAIKVYFDKSSCIDNGNNSTYGWSNINAYAFDSNNTSVRTYTNSADATGSVDWPGKTMNKEGNDIYSILVEPTATQIIFNNGSKQTGDISLPQDDQLNWKNTPVIYRNNKWTSYSASVDTTGVVTDTRLISVLDGSKVMFYGGEANSWGQTYFVAMNTQNTGDVADRAKTDYKKQLTAKGASIDFKFGILCVPAGTYYMGHSGWAPNLSANVVAGDAFVIYNSEINDFTKVAEDGSNLLLQSVSTGTKTATTTLSATEVATGDLLGVTTSTSAGNSSLGFDNTFEYYVHNRTTDKFYKVALSEGKLDTSAFTDDGEYEVKTVLKDANGLYVLADSDNFVISNKAKYSVTFGSNDANMGKVTVSDGTNSYTTSPAFVEKGKSVTFTANPSEGYAVEGWYRDADCKNAITDAGTKTSYEVTVNANTNVYVKFKSTTIDPEYRLTGDLSAIGGWNGYDNALKFDTAESDGSYSKIITVTDDDVNVNNRKYFKLIDKNEKYYGPNDSTYNIISSNSLDTAYNTYENSGSGKDFYFSKAGTYKIHYFIDTTNSRPSVWVEENGKKYSISNDSGKKLTISPNQASAGETVTVTATPENGKVLDTVTVVGADNKSITTTVSGNTATFTMPDQDVTVKDVTFRPAETYTVKFSSSDDNFGTVSATNGTNPLASDTKVTEGDTVKFTAKPKNGYALSGWTVNGVSASSTANPYTITVQKDTTVVANFKVEDSGTIVNDMYFLYGSKNDPRTWEGQQGYNNTEYGKYDVYEKDGKYIVTLNEKHYKELYFAFSKDDSYVNMEPNTGLKPVNSVNPEGLSLVDAKTQEYYVESVRYLFGKMSIVGENSDYIGDIKIIYDPTANTYTVKATKDSVSDTTVNIVGKDGTIRGGYYGKTTSALGNTELKVTSPDNTTITVTDFCKFDGNYQGVTAKKVPYGSKVTVKTTIKSDANFAGHKGSDYYVKGFSINGFTGGVLTQQAGNSHEGDVYEYTFTVNKDVYADVSTIEITPIYFLKNDSDCITFYVENFMDAKDKWGNTIACYAYYNSDHALGDYPGQPMVNAEGSIYMQIPKHIGDNKSNVVKGITLNNYVWDFVHVSGGEDVRKSKNCQTYDYDDFKYLANMSKVNSSDSVADIKNIVYRFKYHTYNNNSAGAGNVPKGTLPETTVDKTKYEVFVDYYDKPTDIFGTVINSSDTVTVETVNAQEEYLTIVSDGYVNYYNETKNYLGQYATKWYIYNKEGKQVAALPPSALLYGLTKSSTQLKDLVTQGAVPTDFMSDSGANTEVISGYWTSFKSLYTAYAGKYAIINYESAIHSSGRDGADVQPGERCDGRWYYSVDKAKITGDIRIEYADTLDSFTKMTGVKTDTFKPGSATGIITAAEAYFTSPAGQSTTDKPTHVETTSDNSENFKFTVGATSSTSYTFVGWYRLIDDTYKAVNDPSELNKTTGQVARNANVVLVARYIKTPGGSMTFNHSLYNGTNAGGGKATTEIQVVVKSSDGSIVYYDSGRIDSTASIDKKTINNIVTGQQDAKITVTLYTTTKNLYDFKGYYSAENKTDITAFPPSTADFTKTVSGDRKNGRVTTSVYTFSFNEYYNKYAGILTATDAGTVYYNFYSDITSIKVPYKVQFSYKDRMEKQKYYNKAGYVDPENTTSYTIDESGNDVKVTLTDSFILTLAPYESNFAKDLTWDENSIRNTAFDSSLDSSIASAVVNSTQSDKKIYLNVYRDKDGRPTPRTNTAGAFKFFEKDGSAKLPYGSVFYTQNPNGTYNYDITAPKTYEGKQFMYWEIYSDSRCRNEDLVIKAYNSEGHFSYVAYDNCWIAPVYGESSTPVASVKEVSTSTQFMEVTRNQWTADTNLNFAGFNADSMATLDKADDFIKIKGEDKLYADFVLNFFYNGKQLSVFDPNSDNVKAGVLIQRLELDRNETTGYITDLNHYAKKYDETELEQAKNDAIDKITTGNSVIKSVKQPIDNSILDNKNRLHYYTIFNNVKGNNNCVFRLYTYIQYTNARGEKAVQLSSPVYFTFYDIANKS